MIVDSMYGILATIAASVVAGFAPRVPIFSRSHLRTKKKIIALTFDDGPSLYTPKVLEILKAKNVKATFFMVGENVRRHPEVAKQVLATGHLLGNHSNDHVLSRLVVRTPSQMLGNLHAADEAIERATGKCPRFYRAPHGYRSVWYAWSLQRAGYRSITWTAMTFDYLDKTSPAYIAKRILARIRPGGVIVLHDGLETKPDELINRQNMIEALPHIIDELQAKGYTLVTLDELFGEPAYRSDG